MLKPRPSACILVIGNEILSGRTQDKNVNYIAKKLTEIGVDLKEVRVIGDDMQAIVNTLNILKSAYNYVFTTGGIGSTHDDLTMEAIAKAFGRKLKSYPKVFSLLESYYKERGVEFNSARQKMAIFPEGATLIENHVTKAPGCNIENVYAFAGVPEIMRAMFDSVVSNIKGGDKIISRSFEAKIAENEIAESLRQIASKYKEVDIGSYPQIIDNQYAVNIVIRCDNESVLDLVEPEIKTLLGL
jgi:molybdenum cofactor synthesis domain-containing protein